MQRAFDIRLDIFSEKVVALRLLFPLLFACFWIVLALNAFFRLCEFFRNEKNENETKNANTTPIRNALELFSWLALSYHGSNIKFTFTMRCYGIKYTQMNKWIENVNLKIGFRTNCELFRHTCSNLNASFPFSSSSLR